MEVMEDHIHVFLSAPPRYAPARIAQSSRASLPGNCLPASPGYAASSGAVNSGKMAISCVPLGMQ